MENFQNGLLNEKKDNDEMIDWWVGTVILAFFPMIISTITSLCRYGTVDINRMFGDGELILSAFLITTPSLINFYKENIFQRGYKLIFYLLLFTAFFQLVAYTTIKTNTSNKPVVVYITSALCVVPIFSALLSLMTAISIWLLCQKSDKKTKEFDKITIKLNDKKIKIDGYSEKKMREIIANVMKAENIQMKNSDKAVDKTKKHQKTKMLNDRAFLFYARSLGR